MENNLDSLNRETIIALILGYFRKYSILNNNIKYDDFADIVSKYIMESRIIFGNNNEKIDLVDKDIYYFNAQSQKFIVSLSIAAKLMYVQI